MVFDLIGGRDQSVSMDIVADTIKEVRKEHIKLLAEFLHDRYNYFAEKNNWNVQKGTSKDFDSLPEKNKQTMLDLSEHLITCLDIDVTVLEKWKKLKTKLTEYDDWR